MYSSLYIILQTMNMNIWRIMLDTVCPNIPLIKTTSNNLLLLILMSLKLLFKCNMQSCMIDNLFRHSWKRVNTVMFVYNYIYIPFADAVEDNHLQTLSSGSIQDTKKGKKKFIVPSLCQLPWCLLFYQLRNDIWSTTNVWKRDGITHVQ